MINQLKPTEIIRDEMGSWVHPDYLKYIDDNHADQEWFSQEDWDQLKKHFNIVTTRLYLEGSVSEDLFEEIMDSADLSKWDPIAPHGFFLIDIGFTEDGAEALFAKEVKADAQKYQTKCWHITTLLMNPVDQDMTLKAIKTVIERVGEG
jgi:hypothetical protein